MDVAASVTAIGTALAPIGAVGTAVFAVLVGIKLVKWVRRAL